MKALKLEVLKNTLGKDKLFDKVVEILSNMERGRQQTTVSRLKRILHEEAGLEVTDIQLAAALKPFEDVGAAKVEYKRKKPVYIDWHLNHVELACNMLNKPSPFKKAEGAPTVRLAPKPRVVLPRLPSNFASNRSAKSKNAAVSNPKGYTIDKDSNRPELITIKAGDVELKLNISQMSSEDCAKISSMLSGITKSK